MNDYDRLFESESVFQEWFRASSHLHREPGCAASDFRRVRDPFDIPNKYTCFDYLLKRTIKIPTSHLAHPEDFVLVLVDYLIDSTLKLYADSVRIAATDDYVLIYKTCGSLLGAAECSFTREGNLVVASFGYQVYHHYDKEHSILMDPSRLKPCDQKNLHATLAWNKYLNSVSTDTKRRWEFIKLLFWVLLYLSLNIAPFLLVPKSPDDEYHYLALAYWVFCANLSLGWLFLRPVSVNLERFYNELPGEKQAHLESLKTRVEHDLSPIHFPVYCYSKQEVETQIAKNAEHKIFIERVTAVLERAVSVGEQAD